MAIDPLDIAYIALGARRALTASPHAGTGLAACEGELGFVEACICHAGLLDRHWHAQADGFPGVWCYEVAEPFGEAFGQHLLAGGSPAEAEHLLRQIVDDGLKACS